MEKSILKTPCNLFFPLLFFLFVTAANAQPLVQEKTRFRFAQTYFGLQTQYLPSGTTALLTPEGKAEEVEIPATAHPRLLIGGTHFWGRADFYVSIPLTSGIGAKAENGLAYKITTGVATGGRIYAKQIHFGKLTPYLGGNWTILKYRQQEKSEQEGPEVHRHAISLEAGISYLTRRGHMLDAGFSYLPEHTLDYAISTDQHTQISFAPVSFQISYKRLLDFTNSPDSVYLAQREQRVREKKKLSGFHISAGPSSAFLIGSSDYNSHNRPFFGKQAFANIFPDLAFGYYLHQPDLNIQVSYRPIKMKQNAYGLEQEAIRNSVSLEAIKFIGDYHGFVPFAGLSFSREHIRLEEQKDGAEITRLKAVKYVPGLVFGWDIRPTRYETFILRTNLRYSPFLGLSAAESDFSFRQLEFNFIQVVVYPGRM